MLGDLNYYKFIKTKFNDLDLTKELHVIAYPDEDQTENIKILEQNDFIVETLKPGIYKISW